MSTKKDYYELLGLSKGATDDQVKSAFRKLAREHHPDVAKDKAAAEAKFKEINEAYQILSDPQKRKAYDQFGHAGVNNGAGGPGAGGFGGFGGQGGFGQWGPFSYSSYSTGGGSEQDFGDIDPFEVFESFFGGARQRTPRSGRNLRYEMRISFAESVKGIEKTVEVESGKVNLKIPAGIQDGNQMKFAGMGMPGPNGLPAGDLYITFSVDLPKKFERVGINLGTLVAVNFVDAILGGTVEVPVVDPNSVDALGTTVLKIPAGTQHGTQFKLKEKGMPIVNSKQRGDVIVQVSVEIPTKLNKKQKEILEQYRKA